MTRLHAVLWALGFTCLSAAAFVSSSPVIGYLSGVLAFLAAVGAVEDDHE